MKFKEVVESYIDTKQKSKESKLSCREWLDSASKRAQQIAVVTHVVKYTHGDAKGTSICDKKSDASLSPSCSQYLTTQAIDVSKYLDVTGNAAAQDITGLLFLEVEGETILSCIERGDSSPFKSFAVDEKQLDAWMEGFSAVTSVGVPSSHTLAKQIYFPVEDGYHLLAPLFPSSLAQALYKRVNEARYGEEVKQLRERKKNKKYSEGVLTEYPFLGVQRFGGANKQNISRLNSSRDGKSYLLRSVPPKWKPIKQPPKGKNSFWLDFESRVYRTVKTYQSFLAEHLNASSNFELRQKSESFVDQLLDELVLMAAEVQIMLPGWSANSDIPEHEKFWLDPNRSDSEFQILKSQTNWEEEVASSFARWLSHKIETDKLKFGIGEYVELKSKCLEIL